MGQGAAPFGLHDAHPGAHFWTIRPSGLNSPFTHFPPQAHATGAGGAGGGGVSGRNVAYAAAAAAADRGGSVSIATGSAASVASQAMNVRQIVIGGVLSRSGRTR